MQLYSKTMTAMMMTLAGGATLAQADDRISVSEMRETFTVTGQILVVSDDGKRLVNPIRESRKWQGMKNGEFRRDWGSRGSDYGDIRIRQHWKIDDAGNMSVTLEEFKKETASKDGPDFQDSAGREEIEVKALTPVMYKSKLNKNVMIRFIPDFERAQTPRQLSGTPMITRDATLYDSEGAVWAFNLESDEEFVGFRTRNGTLAMSFTKFDGATPIGIASGQKITIKGEGTPTLVLQSRGPIVPEGMSATVYARVLPALKSERLRSVHTYESTDRSRFEAKLKKNGSH